ncbi:MAG TPA: hypothetical protein VNY05_27930 [Candidatus Acidoferrales bacterium]|jgi:hypothetical protein|nr:hypothetical protein [Candidatus Acidoferrales bacterium]
MDELVKREKPKPVAVEPAGFNLGQWMGRREAFGLMAGRCSAADVEIVRRIRDEKLYESLDCNWDEFCTRHLHAARRGVEREMGYLRKYGPAFFTVRQLTRISVKDYQSIAGHITEQGVNLDGAVIALHSENTGQVADAVEELLERSGPITSKPAEPVPFDALLKRCRTVVEQLQAFDGRLEADQRLALGRAVADIRTAAGGLGAVIWDRR